MKGAQAQNNGREPGRPGRLLTNASWNIGAFLIAIAANFLTIPLVIRTIGLSEFGAAALVIASYAPFILIGTTLGQSLLRELAPLVAKGEFRLGNQVFSATLRLCALGCACVAGMAFLFAEPLIRLATTHNDAKVDWKVAFAIAFFGWTAQQFMFIFQSAVAATQRYKLVAGISTVAALANAAAIIGFVVYFPSTLGFLAGTSVGFVISLIVWLFLTRHILHWLLPPRKPTAADFRSIIHFGKWQAAAQLAGAIGLQMDRYVLGVLAPLAIVGQYNVAMRLQEVVHMGILKAGEVLFPHFSVTTDDPLAERASFFLSSSWAVNTFAACALTPLIPLASEIITLWINAETASGAAPILRTLATAGILGAGSGVYMYQIMGVGQNALLVRLSIFHASVTIFLTIALISLFGPMVAGAGLLMANAVRLMLVLFLTRRSFAPAISYTQLFLCTLAPTTTGLLASFYWHGIDNISPTNWWELLADYALIACIVALVSILLTSLSTSGRIMLVRMYVTLRALVRTGA